MADQLPVTQTARHITTADKKSTTLLGRGLAAIKSQQLAIVEQGKRYRQGRDIYNQITDYGRESRFGYELMPKRSGQASLLDLLEVNPLQPFYDMLHQLADVYKDFQDLADEGYGKAYFPLACMFNGGQGISKDDEKHNYYSKLAFDWCFANQTLDDLEVWTDLGLIYEVGRGVGRNDEQAVFWYRKAAEQGNATAQNTLGSMYENGYGVEQDDYEAMFWFQKSAEQGNADAQNNLGCMYQYGRGVEQDDEQAMFWYQEAAGQGHATAQNNLGWMYEAGRGVEQDYGQAVFWYRKAAELGDADAQHHLGRMYFFGLVPNF